MTINQVKHGLDLVAVILLGEQVVCCPLSGWDGSVGAFGFALLLISGAGTEELQASSGAKAPGR
jgi:hypothetical protein